ncbi:putative CRM domain-containing protein [Morus notabilis]|uniref:Putative CRM domain-containing protein n=1 Tax=Morus notabilis TaxID=981085 RepID=W9QWP3_9ROSA|nr:putative CRM domain-containing protein [Morus notabilis]
MQQHSYRVSRPLFEVPFTLFEFPLVRRSDLFESRGVVYRKEILARNMSKASIELKTENDVVRFSVSKPPQGSSREVKKEKSKRAKKSKKAKVNELKFYRLMARKKMNSPNPEVRIRYKLEKVGRLLIICGPTKKAIFLLRMLMERYKEAKTDLHMVFIDLEKAYDRVPREVLWWVLEKRGVHVRYIKVIKDMYDRVVTSVRTAGGYTAEFPIRIGLNQGSALSPYLFTIVMDELTREIQDRVPWCMLFADDKVLVDEHREGVNRKWMSDHTRMDRIRNEVIRSKVGVAPIEDKAKRKEAWLIEKLRKFEFPKTPIEVYDPEILTEEEKHYLKRTGEKKKHYVPVGRRGVFGGVVLNMHLHWKNHETIKVICRPCKPGQLQEYAEELARLSKGIVIDIKHNNTIIFYRGKNYVQPKVMSPPDTLSKAKALEKYRYSQSLEHTSQFIEKLEKELEEYRKHIARYKQQKEDAQQHSLLNHKRVVPPLNQTARPHVSFLCRKELQSFSRF